LELRRQEAIVSDKQLTTVFCAGCWGSGDRCVDLSVSVLYFDDVLMKAFSGTEMTPFDLCCLRNTVHCVSMKKNPNFPDLQMLIFNAEHLLL